MIGLMFFPELDILLQTWKKKEYTQFLKHYLERESLITKKYSCCNCLNNSYIKQKSSPFTDCFSWAVNGIWTHDLFLTKEVLYPWATTANLKNSSSLFFPFFRASCRIRTNDPEITNHVLWPAELKRRFEKGKLTMSHRSTIYPCCLPTLGEFDRNWSHRTYPGTKVQKSSQLPNVFELFCVLK